MYQDLITTLDTVQQKMLGKKFIKMSVSLSIAAFPENN